MLYCWVFKEPKICTLKIAYQTQICKRKLLQRRAEKSKTEMSTDQTVKVRSRKMFCTRNQFYQRIKSKDDNLKMKEDHFKKWFRVKSRKPQEREAFLFSSAPKVLDKAECRKR